jgi:septal ring factor EnvC (AmiA/AmiB activator)
MEQSSRLLETLVRFRKWMDEGQELGGVIPSLIQECDRSRQELRQLRQEAADERKEITALQEQLEQVTRERADTTEAMAACLREISRVAGEAMRKFEWTEPRSVAVATPEERNETPRRGRRRRSMA